MRSVIDRFGDLRVAVVGDALVDNYLIATARRLSREAPLPVARVEEERRTPGAAANTAMTTAALGAHTRLLAVVGDDDAGHDLRGLLDAGGVDTAGLIVSSAVPTEMKQRLCVDGQMVARFDTGIHGEPPPDVAYDFGQCVDASVADCDIVIVSDYGSGIVNEWVIDRLARHRRERPGLVIVVDAHEPARYGRVRPTAVKPNDDELRGLIPTFPHGAERLPFIEAHREMLLSLTDADVIAATVDTDGAVVLDRAGPTYRTFARPAETVQTCGAGDAYTAALACALASGADTATAAELAAAAGHIVTARGGTVICTADALREHVTAIDDVIVTPQRLLQRIAYHRSLGMRVVFTNGCFDLLHAGHVSYLSRAKAKGDVLVVAVNSDESVRRLKGRGRPINPFRDRATVLAALSSVDYVVEFVGDSPADLLMASRPDVYVKGGDYTVEGLPEASVAEHVGARVEIVPFVEERSTTCILARIASSRPLVSEPASERTREPTSELAPEPASRDAQAFGQRR